MQVRLLSWAQTTSPDGGIGRRVRFRCVYREVCRFDSCSGHDKQKSLTLKINELGFFLAQKSPCRVNHVSTDFQKFAQPLTPPPKIVVKISDFFLSVDTDFATFYSYRTCSRTSTFLPILVTETPVATTTLKSFQLWLI